MNKFLLLLLGLTFAISCSNEQEPVLFSGEDAAIQDDVSSGIPLTANFEFAQDIVNESDNLGITNLSTGATSYTWDFGNGHVFTDEVPDFTFQSHGIYEVKLTVTNQAGESQTITKSIDVLCVFGGGTWGVEHGDQ